MIGISLALLAALGTLANYMYLSSSPLQVVLTVAAFLSMILYSGRKTRPSYTTVGLRIMTFAFAVCFVSFLGSAGLLLAYLLHLL